MNLTKITRRRFLQGLGFSSMGLIVGGCGHLGKIGLYNKEQLEQIIDQRMEEKFATLSYDLDKKEGEFMRNLSQYVIGSQTQVFHKTKSDEGTSIEKFKIHRGMGVIYKDYYFTANHIVTQEDALRSGDTKINDIVLEKVICDAENDVAIFKIPRELKRYQFPLEPGKEFYIGERVGIIGNPHLKGFNFRIGRISDNNGIVFKEKNYYQKSIGIDKGVIPGDSGTPVVSLDNKKLLGLTMMSYGKILSYFQPIDNFLKHIS